MQRIMPQVVAIAVLALTTFGVVMAATPSRQKQKAETKAALPLGEMTKSASVRAVGKTHSPSAGPASQFTKSTDRVRIPSSVRYTSPSAADIPAIYGCVYYTGGREPIEQAVCRIPTGSGQKFEPVISDVNAIDGGTAVNGTYYAAYHTEYYGEYQLYINGYDISSGAKTVSRNGEPSGEATDVAYNPADGKVYGCFVDPDSPDYSGYYFGTIDYTTATTTKISDLPRQLAAIAISKEGQIYVIDKRQEKSGYTLETVGADLYKINGSTGEMTFIGTTGQLPSYRSSAAIDPASGRMFWTVSPDDECGYLYEVNLSSGAASLVYQFPDDEEVVGLYIPDTGVRGTSPSAPVGLKGSFPGGSLQGYISFTLPATDMEGTSLSGVLNYEVKAGADNVADGSGAPGSLVSVPVTVAAEGLYHFTVTVSNDAGTSPEASLSIFVGHDTPQTPVVEAAIEGSQVRIEWTPVTATVNGGDLTGQEVLYTVRRLPDNKVVARDTRTCSAYDELGAVTALTSYTYTVEATANGITSAAGVSAKVIAGNLTPPVFEDFNKIKTFDFYTVIDANGDGNCWGPYIGNIRIAFSDDQTLAMDDWLITPPVLLEQGKAYKFSVDVATGNASVEETFEVKCGTAPSVAAMSDVVISRRSVAHDDYVTYYGYISPRATGLCYVGIHGCSEPDRYTITVDNLKIEEGVDASLPGEPTDLSVRSRTNGELKADISLFAPEVTLGGEPLRQIDRVEIYREGALVKTFSNPEPGQRLDFTDEVDKCDTYLYQAAAFGHAGRGPKCDIEAFVGVLRPADPENVSIIEGAVPGEVTVSWEPSTHDVDGNALASEYVTYGIYIYDTASGELMPVHSRLTSTSHTFMAGGDPDTQRFVQYFVAAETMGGFSDGISTPIIPVGKPYEVPFRESFSMGRLNSIVATSSAGGASWKLFDESGAVPSVDDDNGFIGSQASGMNQSSVLYTGKVKITGLAKPQLIFYVYNIVDENILCEDRLELDVISGGVTAREWEATISTLADYEGWIRVAVPLDDYNGKEVRFAFTSRHNTWSRIYLDRLSITDNLEHNLSAGALSAPATVKAGTKFTISATIDNNGASYASDYMVDLYCNGVKIDSRKGPFVEADRSARLNFTCTLPAVETDRQTYNVEIVYPADLSTDDNVSSELTVEPTFPTLPYVRELTASADAAAVALAWSEPDNADYIADAVTESFESYPSWSTGTAGDWSFVDRDGAGIGGFNDGTQFPGIPANSVQSFWIFDSEEDAFKGDVYFMSNTGTKHLAQMFSYTTAGEVRCDDWAISPALDGRAQTISFYARCYYGNYPETFEVLWSAGGAEPEDFELVKSFTTASDDWQEYSVELPDGAGRFAIRCVSKGGFMFFIDDVTFIPKANPDELELKGYNIYRDKVLVGNVGRSTRAWTDTSVDATPESEYAVTALYNLGESRPSNSARPAGIGSVTAETISITGARGEIRVTGTPDSAEIKVWKIDGTVAASVVADKGMTSIPAAPGIYAVGTCGVTVKVVVR